MNRLLWFVAVIGGLPDPAWAEPVLARWGGGGGEPMIVEVRGFDDAGFLRIAPTDGAQGEALLPVSEVGDLRFIFSEAYQEARLRVSVGRPAEALYLLQQEMPGFVPYAVLADSNVPPAVRLYLRLLQHGEAWPEAVAVGAALTQSGDSHDLIPDVLSLIQALIRVERIEDASWLLSRVNFATDSTYAEAVERVAAQLRRAGHWREAREIYERLSASSSSERTVPWQALAAYCAWHEGHPDVAEDLLAEHASQSASDWEGLLGLLRGRLALREGEAVAALDSLGEALINAPAASEWRLEITAVLAEGYAAHGQPQLAERLQAELKQLYPDFPWSLSKPKT